MISHLHGMFLFTDIPLSNVFAKAKHFWFCSFSPPNYMFFASELSTWILDCCHATPFCQIYILTNTLYGRCRFCDYLSLWCLVPSINDTAAVYYMTWWRHQMETFFRVTGHLCGELTGHRWIPLIKVSDAELWCFLWSSGWYFETPSHSLWRHCNDKWLWPNVIIWYKS